MQLSGFWDRCSKDYYDGHGISFYRLIMIPYGTISLMITE